MTRDDCIALDANDPLAAHRQKFALPDGVIYLDGNSLGALPRATRGARHQVIEREWGTGLIRSWNAAHWIDLPRRVGAKIAQLDWRAGTRSHMRGFDVDQSVQGVDGRAAPASIAAAGFIAGRTVILSESGKLSDRPVRGAGRRRPARSRARVEAGRVWTCGCRDRRLHRRRLADARELQDRRDARPVVAHEPCTRRRRAGGLGPFAFGRRGAGRPERGAAPISQWVRLQVFERRSGRAGVRLRRRTASGRDRRALRATARRLVRPSHAVRVRHGLSARRPRSTVSPSARRRSLHCPRSKSASTPCSPQGWTHCAQSRSR